MMLLLPVGLILRSTVRPGSVSCSLKDFRDGFERRSPFSLPLTCSGALRTSSVSWQMASWVAADLPLLLHLGLETGVRGALVMSEFGARPMWEMHLPHLQATCLSAQVENLLQVRPYSSGSVSVVWLMFLYLGTWVYRQKLPVPPSTAGGLAEWS